MNECFDDITKIVDEHITRTVASWAMKGIVDDSGKNNEGDPVREMS